MTFSKKDKETILKKHAKCCCYCRVPLTIETMTIDHVIPSSKNGSDDMSNLVAACDACNKAKGDTEFKSKSELNEFRNKMVQRLAQFKLNKVQKNTRTPTINLNLDIHESIEFISLHTHLEKLTNLIDEEIKLKAEIDKLLIQHIALKKSIQDITSVILPILTEKNKNYK